MNNLSLTNLDKTAHFWQHILDATYNGVVVIDDKGTILVYNKAARRIFSDRNRVIVGRPLSEIRPESWPDLLDILKSGRPQLGRKIVLPEATIIVNRCPIIIKDKIAGIISVFQDISEYESIISELQGYHRLHHELEAIIESSHDGLYIADGKAETIRVNKSYERITGLSRENLIGRNMKELVNEKVFDHSVTLEVLKKRTQVTIIQKVMGNKQVMVTGTPIFDENDEIALVVTNVRDITELNELRAQVESTRRISSRYYQELLEHEGVKNALEEMVVKSEAMMQVLRKAIKVANVETSVFLHGESGVGKSMLARIIHQISSRKNGPFVKINCGTIPASLMESELFGYEEGAFTGAVAGGKAGLVEAGHRGTIFLDEIAELKPDLQVKLLSVIEEKAFTRVGSTKPTSVNVRIIAATNRNLKEMLQKGLFREDLYYRLNVVPIFIPPMRLRREDIPALILNIVEKFNHRLNLNKRLNPEVIDRLKQYHYPGNVRELINVLEHMIIMSEGDRISIYDLPTEIKEQGDVMKNLNTSNLTLKESVEILEAERIRKVLISSETLALAAEALSIHPTTLWRKMVKYNIKAKTAFLQ